MEQQFDNCMCSACIKRRARQAPAPSEQPAQDSDVAERMKQKFWAEGGYTKGMTAALSVAREGMVPAGTFKALQNAYGELEQQLANMRTIKADFNKRIEVYNSKGFSDASDLAAKFLEIEDNANIGIALLEAIKKYQPTFEWNTCPSEIVLRLTNENTECYSWETIENAILQEWDGSEELNEWLQLLRARLTQKPKQEPDRVSIVKRPLGPVVILDGKWAASFSSNTDAERYAAGLRAELEREGKEKA